MTIITITEREQRLTHTLKLMTDALERTTAERDALRVQLHNARDYGEKMLHAAINAKRELDSQIQSNQFAQSSKIEA